MDKLLLEYIENPKSAALNFQLASEFERLKHYAAACSYYLRCAEWGDPKEDKNLIYESLIHISLCFRDLGNRQYSEEGWLFHAIAVAPKRREAYWLLSQLYERQRKWAECYNMAVIGLSQSGHEDYLSIDIGYEGEYVLVFQKAVSAWWISKLQESRMLFISMPDKYSLSEAYVGHVQQNINTIGVGPRTFDYFSKQKANRFRFPFHGIEKVERNYSQVYQDMFVLAALKGKTGGFYLEIGSADPVHVSNTYLLETVFGYQGISIEINEKEVEKFSKLRKNPVVCRDATLINFDSFLPAMNAPAVIDYLQIDCEPPATTYRILTQIPFEHYRFAVITFEHDYFVDASRKYRDLSRRFLKMQGYELLISNVSSDDSSPFEDWWIHPKLVSKDVINNMRNADDSIKRAEGFMLRA